MRIQDLVEMHLQRATYSNIAVASDKSPVKFYKPNRMYRKFKSQIILYSNTQGWVCVV